jgi:hypothetical protein
MDDLLRERGCRPDFTLEFVKYGQYSPHSSEKSDSAPRPLATATILGQPHREPVGLTAKEKGGQGRLFHVHQARVILLSDQDLHWHKACTSLPG